jgi:hypothetical protein
VDPVDAKETEKAKPGCLAAERPERHHRVRTALVVLLSLVLLFTLVSVVLTLEGRGRPVSVNQAASRYHSDPSAEPGTHPRPGVYSYQGTGTGTDSLSLPPLSQAEGPTVPGPSRSKPMDVGASALTIPPTTGRAGPTAHAPSALWRQEKWSGSAGWSVR